MTVGYLTGPLNLGNPGQDFILQPTNYSDKGTPHIHHITVKNNYFLKPGKANTDKLKQHYIDYQINKNEQLQSIMIKSFTDTIGGSFNAIHKAMKATGASKSQLKALTKLRDMLVNKKYPQKGDMTKAINEQLAKVKLDKDILLYSDANLDSGADYITLGNSSTIYLKPHMGVRAALYSDLKQH